MLKWYATDKYFISFSQKYGDTQWYGNGSENYELCKNLIESWQGW